MQAGKPVATRVLIVGAGPSGLALAIELGHRGVPCLVIERNDRVGYAPRAKTTNVRTREHLRRWGIADKLREWALGPVWARLISVLVLVSVCSWFDLGDVCPDECGEMQKNGSG